jgi:hypothetical protein
MEAQIVDRGETSILFRQFFDFNHAVPRVRDIQASLLRNRVKPRGLPKM